MPEIFGTEPKAMTCQCCGAPLTRTPMGWKCDYCGTSYADDRGVLKIISVPARVEHLRCDVEVDDMIVYNDPDYASKYILSQISQQLAEKIAPYMQYETESYPFKRTQRVKARIGVVLPADGVSSFWTR